MTSASKPALESQQPYYSTLRAVPIYLPHDQPANSNLKEKLKTIAKKSLLKQYSIQSTVLPPEKHRTPTRPKMRMKDSDDYITARAANPRTGMISPGIAGTPGSPSPAVKHRHPSPSASPTQDISARPALRRANEGRKLSASSVQQRWSMDEKGWFNDDLLALSAASPRTSDASAGAVDLLQHVPAASGSTNDRFVVNMPSAREPQPYAYPGRSAKEIEAFEHYRRKARRVSGEGWDQRCVQSNGEAGRTEVRGRRNGSGSQETHAYTTALKRGLAGADLLNSMDLEDYTVASFAPYSSPRTPARRTSGTHRVSKPAQAFAAPIPRKPISTKLQHGPTAEDANNPIAVTHLSQLPKVDLRHPELASLPVAKLRSSHHQQHGGVERKCSLGCERSAQTGVCVPRTPDKLTCHTHVAQLFADPDPQEQETWPLDFLSWLSNTYTSLQPLIGTVVESLTLLSLHVRVPRPALVRTLTTAEASPKQKVAALRALLAAGGQILALLVVVSLAWKLMVAVAQVFGILLWPIVVPLRVIRWVVVGW